MLILTINDKGSVDQMLLPSGSSGLLMLSADCQGGQYTVKISGMEVCSAIAQPITTYNRALTPKVLIDGGKINVSFSNGNITVATAFKLTIFPYVIPEVTTKKFNNIRI